MDAQILIKLVQAAEAGLSRRQASERLDIPYRTVSNYSKNYKLKFVCGRRMANERSKQQRDQLKANGVEKISETTAHLQRPSCEKGSSQFEDANRGTDIAPANSQSEIDQKLKLLLSEATSHHEKIEIGYWYKWVCFESNLIRRKKRPGFPKRQRKSWGTFTWAKQESLDRRTRIMNTIENDPQTTHQISSLTGFDIRSTALFMHNLWREGKVERDVVPPSYGSKKNKVYIYRKSED